MYNTSKKKTNGVTPPDEPGQAEDARLLTEQEKATALEQRIAADLAIVAENVRLSMQVGDVVEHGRAPSGEMCYGLSSKGMVRVACRIFYSMVDAADKQQRDFTDEERKELLEHVEILARRLINMRGTVEA